jgi:hypothetical protein
MWGRSTRPGQANLPSRPRQPPHCNRPLTSNSAHLPGPAPPHGSAPIAPAQPLAREIPVLWPGLPPMTLDLGFQLGKAGGAGVGHVRGNWMNTREGVAALSRPSRGSGPWDCGGPCRSEAALEASRRCAIGHTSPCRSTSMMPHTSINFKPAM